MKKLIHFIIPLMILGLIFLGSTTGTFARVISQEKEEVIKKELVKKGESPNLTIFYLGDVIGRISPCGWPSNPAGGLARRANYINEYRKVFPKSAVLLLDTGNMMEIMNNEAAEIKNEAFLYTLNKLGWTAVNVSENEMYAGLPKLIPFLQKANFAFLSSNLVYEKSNKPVFNDKLIIKRKLDKVGKIKIGILAFTRIVASLWDSGSEERIKVADYYELANKIVPTLRKDVDLLIVLARLEHKDAVRLAQEVPGIDIILATFGGERSIEPLKFNNTLVLFNGGEGKFLGELRLFIDKNKKISSFKNDYIFLTKDVPDDPDILTFVSNIEKKIEELNKAKLEMRLER